MAYCAWCLEKASDCRCPRGPSEIPDRLRQRVVRAIEVLLPCVGESPSKFEGLTARLNTAPPSRPTTPPKPAERIEVIFCCWREVFWPWHRCKEA